MVNKYYEELYSKVFFLLILIGILVIGFLIIKPFIAAIISGTILAYLFYPLYKRIGKRIKNENARAFLVSLLLILIVTIPGMIALSLLAKEAFETYSTIEQHRLGSNFIEFICTNGDNMLCSWTKSFLSFLPASDLNTYMQSVIEKITSGIIQSLSRILAAIPSLVLNIVIILFVVYYLLKDGKKMISHLSGLLPLSKSQKGHVFERFGQITYGVFIGNLAVALIQGVAGGIGFMIFGISSPILWGFVMALFALIPYFGTAIVWLPAALNMILIGNLTANNSMTVKGILLIIYGLVVISSVDNLVKPRIIGSKADIHPLLVLLGVFGGLNLFGVMGFIIGPIMLALLLVLINIYKEEMRGKNGA